MNHDEMKKAGWRVLLEVAEMRPRYTKFVTKFVRAMEAEAEIDEAKAYEIFINLLKFAQNEEYIVQNKKFEFVLTPQGRKESRNVNNSQI